MTEKSFVKKGIKVFAQKDFQGKYYVTAAFSNRRPPESNAKAILFYKKNKLGSRIDKVQRNNAKFNTFASLKRGV